MRGVIPAGFAAGIDRRNPPRNFQYTNALPYVRLRFLTRVGRLPVSMNSNAYYFYQILSRSIFILRSSRTVA